jgi:hypothetical protein
MHYMYSEVIADGVQLPLSHGSYIKPAVRSRLAHDDYCPVHRLHTHRTSGLMDPAHGTCDKPCAVKRSRPSSGVVHESVSSPSMSAPRQVNISR